MRATNFTINRYSPLAQGLMFAGLGQHPGSVAFVDSMGGPVASVDAGIGDPLPIWVPTPFGWGLKFSGVGSHDQHVQIDARYYGGLKFEGANDSFTASCWFKCSNTSLSAALFYIQDVNDDMWRLLYFHTPGKIYGSVDAIDAIGSKTVVQDKWIHMACVFDKNGNAQVYQDGVPDGAGVALNNEVMSLTTNYLYIGAALGTTLEAAGIIAQPMIHNRALSPAEVWQLADPANHTLSGLIVPIPQTRYFFVPTAGAYTLVCAQGSYAVNGQAVALEADRTLALAQGSYAVNGQATSLEAGRTLALAQGSYAVNGQAVTLTYTPAGAYVLVCDQGSYAVNGQTVELVTGRTLVLAQGSYTYTGQVVGLTAGHTLALAQGSYTYTGQAMGAIVARVLTAAQGSYAYTGQTVTLTYSGADVIAVPGVEYRLNDARPHYRVQDARPHYSISEDA